MQHAVVRSHENHFSTAVLSRFENVVFRSLDGIAQVLIPIPLTTTISRIRIDDVAKTRISVPELSAIGLLLTSITSQPGSQFGIASHEARIKLFQAGCRSYQQIPVCKRHGIQLVGGTPFRSGFDIAVFFKGECQQITTPSFRIETRLINKAVCIKASGVCNDRRRRGCPAIYDILQSIGELFGECRRLSGTEKTTTTVNPCMKQVVNFGFAIICRVTPSYGNRRILNGFKCGIRIDRTSHPETNTISHHMLPESRISFRSGNFICQIRLKIIFPILHRHIGQRIGMIITKWIFFRITEHLTIFIGVFFSRFPILVTHAGAIPSPVSICHKNRIAGTALVITPSIITRRRAVRALVISARIIFTDIIQRLSQWRTATGVDSVEPGEETIAVAINLEGGHPVYQRPVFVQSSVTDTHI